MGKYDNRHKPRVYIHPLNKLNEYMKFDKRDNVICDFIDYVAFYGCRDNPSLRWLFASDNWPAVYVGRITLTKSDNRQLFTLFWQYVKDNKVVQLFRIQELKLPKQEKDKRFLKVDLYGKWVKLIREDWLREDVYTVLTRYCGFKEKITLTRVDYTCDCATYNFRKPNSLKSLTKWSIYKTERRKNDRELDVLNTQIETYNQENNKKRKKVEYLLFGNKSSSTARFIRYYDKKAEIIARWTQFLYPEYFEYPSVMRYELQVNSKWLDDSERHISVEDLYSFITFGYSVLTRKEWKHRAVKNFTLYEYVKYAIRKLKREQDYWTLEQIKLLLFNPEELPETDSVPIITNLFEE